MNYELLIETSPDKWERVDLGDESPAMVFQINDLNQLNTRQASYSQALRLPITTRNCALFGYANEFEAKSAVPYVVRRCVLYCDGLVVAGTSFRLELRSVSTAFNCQIVSNIRDLFEILAEKTMSEISGFSDPFTWEVQDVANQNGAFPNFGRKYFAAASSKSNISVHEGRFEMPAYEDDNGNRVAMLATLYPYYPLLETVRQLLSDEGYTLDTDIEQVAGYAKAFFSLPELKPGPDSFANIATYRRCGGIVVVPDTTATLPGGTEIIVYPGTKFPAPLSQVDIGGTNRYNEWTVKSIPNPDAELTNVYAMEYTAPGALKIRLQCQTTSDTGTAEISRLRYRVRKRAFYINSDSTGGLIDDTISEAETGDSGLSQYDDIWTTDEIELAPGERVYVEAYLLIGNPGATYVTQINVLIDPEENSVCPGGKIYPGESTDFKTQLDFLKMFIQLYGLFVDVDTETKTLRARTFNYFYRRIAEGDFADWSEKIDVSDTRKTGFKVGSYAQVNNVLFGNNTVLNFQDKAGIPVDNTNLAATKDLFTVAAESTTTQRIFVPGSPVSGQDVAVGDAEISARLVTEANERFKYDYKVHPTEGNYEIWMPNVKVGACKTHIVRKSTDINDWTGVLTYIPQRGSSTAPYNFCLPLTADYFVTRFYAPLTKMLNPVRVIEAYFYLTPVDIANLDLLRPVYIDAYGDYFYIQKIDNYISNRRTRCTLVCLNATNE